MALMTSWLTVPLLVTSHGRSFWIKWMWTMDGHDELSFTFVNVHKLLSTLLLSHTKSEKNKQTKSTTTSLYWSSSPETPKRDISMTFLAQRKTLSLQLNPIHALNMWSWERSSGVASFFSCLSEDVSNWENQTYLFFFVCLCVFVWSFLSKKTTGWFFSKVKWCCLWTAASCVRESDLEVFDVSFLQAPALERISSMSVNGFDGFSGFRVLVTYDFWDVTKWLRDFTS